MNLRDDDEDLFLSPSSQNAFENTEQAKKKAKEKKAKQKGKLLSLKRMLLRGQIQEDDTSTPLAEPPETFGTKTHKQMEDAAILDAQKEFTADDLVEESHHTADKKDDTEQERANEDV